MKNAEKWRRVGKSGESGGKWEKLLKVAKSRESGEKW